MSAANYQPYPTYEETGIEWIGKAPAEWRVQPFFVHASQCKRSNKGMVNDNLLSLSFGRVIRKNIETSEGLLPESFETYQVIEPNDMVFRLTDLQNDKRSLRSALCQELGIITSAYLAAKPVGIEPSYLSYLMRSYDLTKVLYALGSGLRQSLKYSDMKRLPLVVPSLEEQTQIAKFLDYETVKIGALIEKQQQLIALLEEKRQAVISHTVTKGLNPDAPMRDSGVEWLGKVPANWTVVRLKHTCEIQSGMPKGKPASATTVDMPMLRVANVQDGWLNLGDVHHIPVEGRQVARYLLRSGDVLMNEGGDRDKLGRGTIWRGEVPNCIHQNHVFAIRTLSIEPEWLDAVTRADYAKFHFYRVAKQSTNLASISSSNIKETPLVVPPVDERKAILDHIALMTEKTSTTIELAGRQNVVLQERRTALISAAVTGKIDVRDWKAPEAEAEVA